MASSLRSFKQAYDSKYNRNDDDITTLLKNGTAYMCNNVKESYSLFKQLKNSERNALAIIRKHPDKFKAELGIDDIETFWLKVKEASLLDISVRTVEFMKEGNTVILIDGIDFLITVFQFDKVLKLIQSMTESIVEKNAILLVALEKESLETKEFRLLSGELDPLPDLE